MKIDLYYDNKNGNYVLNPVKKISTYYYILSIAFVLALKFMNKLEPLWTTSIILIWFSCSMILGVWIWQKSKENGGLSNFYHAYELSEAIKYQLVRTRILKRLKDVDSILVPWVYVIIKNDEIEIQISKISSLQESDLDDLRQIINSVLKGPYKNYLVDSSNATTSENGKYFDYVATDINKSLTWIPKSIAEIPQKPYMIKLQDDLVINMAKSPHVGIFGTTGGGKTTAVLTILAEIIGCSDLVFFDIKDEYSMLENTVLPSELFFNEADEIEQVLEMLVTKEMPARQKELKEARKKLKKRVDGVDINMKPLYIICDEMGNMVFKDNKQKKHITELLQAILQRGRSNSMFCIYATQDPSITGGILKQGAMSQFHTRLLLGTANKTVQTEVFGSAVYDGSVKPHQGYYFTDGLSSAQRFYNSNLVDGKFLEVDSFKTLSQGNPQQKMIQQILNYKPKN